jgi:hypothetical protein
METRPTDSYQQAERPKKETQERNPNSKAGAKLAGLVEIPKAPQDTQNDFCVTTMTTGNDFLFL